jgi:hypothetical protein
MEDVCFYASVFPCIDTYIHSYTHVQGLMKGDSLGDHMEDAYFHALVQALTLTGKTKV